MVTSRSLVIAAAVPVGLALFALIVGPYLLAPPHLKESRKDLQTARVIELPVGGPESLDWDPNGEGPYVGVADGRILKWLGEGRGWTEFAVTSPNREKCSRHEPAMEHICGRPLGIHFEKKSGDLYICDCYFGIMKVGPEGGLATKVVDEAAGRKFTFTNHMDIDEVDDILYFTDSSDKYHIRTVLFAFLSGEKMGRLISYNKNTKETKVLMEGLIFPNGVALSKDRSFVIVAESATGKLHRHWLRGPKAGTNDLFTQLPGPADNIRRNEKGEIWVGLHSKTTLFQKLALVHPLVGKTILKSVKMENLWPIFEGFKPHAAAVKVGENGEILEIIEDEKGETVTMMSEVQERNGQLWLGSFMLPKIWVYDLK